MRPERGFAAIFVTAGSAYTTKLEEVTDAPGELQVLVPPE
jgi:hypothetical protein